MRQLFWILLLGLALLPARARTQEISPSDPLAQALKQTDVYVGKTMRDKVDAQALTQLTDTHRGSERHYKIVVVSQLPPEGKPFGTRDAYTRALHRYLNMDRGILIVVTAKGVSASTNALPPDKITAILQKTASQIQRDPVNGLRKTVQAFDGQIGAPAKTPRSASPIASSDAPLPGGSQQASSNLLYFLWLIPIGFIAVFVIYGVSASSEKRRAMQEAQIPVRRLHGEVVEGLSYADTYLDLLPPSQEREAALQQRQNAAELMEQAKGFARSARTPQDYGRAQALLEQAKGSTDACRRFIDVATGGTSLAVAVEGTDYRVTPAIGGSQAAPIVSGLRAEDIPAAERGACFFCSRPEYISRMTPLTVALQGQRRKVLACADCVQIVQNGATPQVRTVPYNGRQVPWYSSRSYDPYRDYTHSEAHYVPSYYGYDNGDFAAGFLFGTFLVDPYPMLYPVFIAPSGDLTNDFQAAVDTPAMNSDLPPWAQGSAVGGADDFFGTNAQAATDYSTNTDSGGSVDFSSSSSSSDFGSTDFSSSSSSDFSSSSSSDFSSSDSGSSSSSGGGDY